MSVDIKVRRLILRCFQNGFSAGHAACLVGEKFGIKGYATRTCQRWFRKFREGDFNLFDKPTHDGRSKAKPEPIGKFRQRPPQREVKVEKVTFQQENRPQDHRTRTSAATDVVQKLMQKNRQLTISRVKPCTVSIKETTRLMPRRSNPPVSGDSTPKEGLIRVKEPSKLMSRRISPPPSKAPLSSSLNQRRPASSVLQQGRQRFPSKNIPPRSQSRLRGSLRTDLRLPPSIVKRMASTRFSTENHTINEGVKGAQKAGETTKKPITVQFQNVSPEVAKNTVRKSTESGQSSTSGSKKQSTQSSNPLGSPKGVIYLNPQEVFGEKLPPKKAPVPKSPVTRAANSASAKTTPATVASKATSPPPIVTVDDSDSEDDVLLPENVTLPPPKVKAVVNTFTTYWDMESDNPILLNPSSEVISSLPVIELE